jgi:hypothetical protein
MKLTHIVSVIALALFAFACSSDDSGMSINSVTPNAGNSGLEVTITGENFGTVAADVTVRFGPAAAEIISITNVQIVTTIPASAPIGATTIQVVKGDETQTIDFNINDPIVGNWISSGANIAPLLAGPPFNTTSITADFKSDGTYIVVTTDANNSQVTLEGTYQTSEGLGLIRNISLTQTSPTVLTSEGIYQNEDGLLTYEVAQTNPPLTGVTKPTPEGGFGSTANGLFGVLNVQKYVRAAN